MTSQSPVPGTTSQVSTAGATIASSTQTSTPTSALSLPAPRCSNTSEPMNESVRANFLTTPGFVVPAPSFPYSVISQSSSSSASHQQSQSTPVAKVIPPASAAALQPPVPTQQFRPSTIIGPGSIHGAKLAPPNISATALQPPVPRQSVRPFPFARGAFPQTMPAPMQSSISVPRGHSSIASGFSFGGASQSTATTESSQSNQSSNSSTSATVKKDAGTVSAVSSSSQSTEIPVHVPSSMNVPSSSNVHPMTTWMQSAPLPGLPGTSGTLASPGMPLSASMPPANAKPIDPSKSPRPMPSPVSIPSTSAAVIVQQQFYQPYQLQPAMAPPPQGNWLPPSQVSGLQRPAYVPYAAGPPAPFPLPVRGMLHSVPLPDSQPPGVSPVTSIVGTPPGAVGSIQPASSSVNSQLPPPGIDQDKQSDNIISINVDAAKSVDADLWTAHKTETGAVYYYNSLTGQSTYERPANFKGELDKVPVQWTPISKEELFGMDWVLVTTNDGKKYYHNTKTKVSSWEVPAEVVEFRKRQEHDSLKDDVALQNASASSSVNLNAPSVTTGGREAMALRASGAMPSSALDLVKKKLQDSGMPAASSSLPVSSSPMASDVNGQTQVETSTKGLLSENSKEKFKDATNGDGNRSDSSSDSDGDSGPTKEECIIQFKEMLKERGVAPFSKWEKELPKILFDSRFKAVPGYSTRRALFEHYVRTRAEEERKEKRAAQKAAVEGFKQLLEEVSEDIDHKTDYYSFKGKWGGDPRFKVLDRKDRENLLNERVLPLRKAVEEKIQEERAAAVSSFKSMLRDSGDINTSSRWSKVKDNLRNDPRYKSVKHEDREVLFNEYISELKAAEQEAERAAKAKSQEQEKLKEREREMRKRKEREEQEMERVRLKVRRKEAVASYQALLVETIKDPKASWTESRPKLEKDPQGRATNSDLDKADAEKLFRGHVKALYERCVRDFHTLLADVITADAAARVTDDGKNILTSWSEAKQLLKPDPRYSKMPRKDRESVWRRFVEEIQRRHKPSSDGKEEKPLSDFRNRISADSERSPRFQTRR